MRYLKIYLTSVLAKNEYIPLLDDLFEFLREKGVTVELFKDRIRIITFNNIRQFRLPKKCYDINEFVDWCKRRVEYFLKKDTEELKALQIACSKVHGPRSAGCCICKFAGCCLKTE